MLCAECYVWFTQRVYMGHNPKQSWKAQLFTGNKSTGNPWFSAHEKVLFFKHTDVFKWKITLLTFSECDHVVGADINHCRAVCCRQSLARGLQAQGGTCPGSHPWGVAPVPPEHSGCRELGWGMAVFRVCSYCTGTKSNTFLSLRESWKICGFFFFFFPYISLFLSVSLSKCFWASLSTSASVLSWCRTQVLKGFAVVAFVFSPPSCVFSSSTQMYGTSSGKEGGGVTKYRRSKNTINLVNQNHEYNNKNIFEILVKCGTHSAFDSLIFWCQPLPNETLQSKEKQKKSLLLCCSVMKADGMGLFCFAAAPHGQPWPAAPRSCAAVDLAGSS